MSSQRIFSPKSFLLLSGHRKGATLEDSMVGRHCKTALFSLYHVIKHLSDASKPPKITYRASSGHEYWFRHYLPECTRMCLADRARLAPALLATRPACREPHIPACSASQRSRCAESDAQTRRTARANGPAARASSVHSGWHTDRTVE